MSVRQRLDRLLIGGSAAMLELKQLILRLAPRDLTVLIEGPTGTGKELVAKALHLASGRSGEFVPVNVCAVPDGLFEDTLYGRVKGAYTGADSDRQGLLQMARGGTILLDEIGGLDLSLQTKLLRFLETGDFRKLGSPAESHSNARIVAATNDDLAAICERGRFRYDLFQRLSGFKITVPPLKDRIEDVPALAAHFIESLESSESYTLLPEAVLRMQEYDWPGNVRELRNVIQRVAILNPDGRIKPDEIEQAIAQAGPRPEPQRSYEWTKRDHFLKLLKKYHWDTGSLARAIGRDRSTIYRRMKRLNISKPVDGELEA